MNLPDGSPLARTMADADSGEADTYDRLTPFYKAKMDRMASAVMKSIFPTDEQIEVFARILEPGSFAMIDGTNTPDSFARTVAGHKAMLARSKVRAIMECLFMGATPEQIAMKPLRHDPAELNDPTQLVRRPVFPRFRAQWVPETVSVEMSDYTFTEGYERVTPGREDAATPPHLMRLATEVRDHVSTEWDGDEGREGRRDLTEDEG